MSTLSTIVLEIDQQLDQAIKLEGQELQTQFQITEQEHFRRYILTKIGALKIAVPIDDLSEVSVLPQIKHLPNLPTWILGIVNLREEIVSVIDLNGLLALDSSHRKGERVAVIKNDMIKVGVVIDQILGTVSLPDSSIQQVSDETTGMFTQVLLMDEVEYGLLTAEMLLNFKKLTDYYEEH